MPPIPDPYRKPPGPSRGTPAGSSPVPPKAAPKPAPKAANNPAPKPAPKAVQNAAPKPATKPRVPTPPPAATRTPTPPPKPPEPKSAAWELRISRPVWWGGVIVLALLLIGCFEFGSKVGERRAARLRKEASTQIASAQLPAKPAAPPEVRPQPQQPKAAPVSVPTPKDPPTPTPARPTEKLDPPTPPPVTPKAEPKKTVEIPPPVEPTVPVRFEKDILPVFQAKCISCHGGLSKKGGLDLKTLASAMKGGNSGPGVKPGKPGDSPIWETVRTGNMPPGNKPQLTAEEKKLILAWIAGDAR